MGQVMGCKEMDNSFSISSNRSNRFFPSRSSLLMNTITGVLRIRHTCINLRVCSSTPLTLSTTRMTLSTAVRVLKVSSAKSLWPGVSKRLIKVPSYSKLITEVATEIPLCLSISIKSDVAAFLILLLFTAPATWMAPPNNRNFSVSVVLPASGCDMIAKVRRFFISFRYFIVMAMVNFYFFFTSCFSGCKFRLYLLNEKQTKFYRFSRNQELNVNELNNDPLLFRHVVEIFTTSIYNLCRFTSGFDE